MFLLYEEDGDIKAGTLLMDNVGSLQIESQHGRRGKLKAANVLLRFASPAPAEVMQAARVQQADLDLDFLWEAAGEAEFGFEDLAADYYGHKPSAPEAAAIALALHGAPIFFQKKGKGRYKAAPAEQLAAAKAALERKARETAQRARWVEELKAGRLPEDFSGRVSELAHKPDKNSLEYKALADASAETGLSVVRLLDRCGAISSPHEFHVQAFLLTHFPRGRGFPAVSPPPPPPPLPFHPTPAFSIDDAETTEIDDAFSVVFRPDGSVRVGIHIAAPALAIAPGSELDRLAASRLSTVYLPGDKITMLPEGLFAEYNLAQDQDCPALSLYVDVAPDHGILALATRMDRIHVAANLRHASLEQLFNVETIGRDGPDYAFRGELEWLHGFAGHLARRRGKEDAVQRHDYLFQVTGEAPNERVEIIPRLRGNPIDKLVSEMMILANSHWAGMLVDKGVAGVYRAQTAGKVRMSLKPAPHEGLGVEQYVWSTSPLRRYVDLINQRQILAASQGDPAPHAGNDPLLFAIMRDFELAYDAYAEFQRRMERYWCLRWLAQEGVRELGASLIRENLVRFDRIPLITRVSGAPTLNPGDRMRVEIGEMDLLEIELKCRYLGPWAEPSRA
ncbi:MAG TPA: RNB domain-containing ribonuclease [Thiobacillaceae bacterium]|nr:RNB domain-containing ribonuclease [Thiobacillaceae bacterium]HNU63845.1 RNB domain-containing ribonuclease [Thiobacillaceae bacterium]